MTCGIDSGCNHDCRQGRQCSGRTKTPAPVWLTPVLTIGMIVALCYVGPAIDDHSGEMATADAAINQIKRERKEAMAARAICGENAGYRFDGNTLQFLTKRGAKTITAKVTP